MLSGSEFKADSPGLPGDLLISFVLGCWGQSELLWVKTSHIHMWEDLDQQFKFLITGNNHELLGDSIKSVFLFPVGGRLPLFIYKKYHVLSYFLSF